MTPLRIGILGCADIAVRQVIPTIKSLDQFQLVAIASRSQIKADRWADKFQCEGLAGYQSLLDRTDIDIVYIPLPNSLHSEWTNAALKRGKHVLVEKPFATNYSSTKETVNLAIKKGKLLVENFQFQYHSQFNFIKELLANKVIGEIRNVRASFGYPPLSEDNHRNNQTLGGGALLDAGCYTVKVTQLILGAILSVESSFLRYDKKREIDIHGCATLSNDDGINAQLTWGMDNFYQNELQIWGSKGKITANRIFTAHPDVHPKVFVETAAGSELHELPTDNHFRNILLNLYGNIQSNSYKTNWDDILSQSRLLQELKDMAKHHVDNTSEQISPNQ